MTHALGITSNISKLFLASFVFYEINYLLILYQLGSSIQYMQLSDQFLYISSRLRIILYLYQYCNRNLLHCILIYYIYVSNNRIILYNEAIITWFTTMNSAAIFFDMWIATYSTATNTDVLTFWYHQLYLGFSISRPNLQMQI